MRFRGIVAGAAFLIVLSVCGYAWYRFVVHQKATVCGYCPGPLHANLSVTAEIAGKRTEVCCARCAITEANQERKPLRLIVVHDHTTGNPVAPEKAWFVEGSRAAFRDPGARRHALPLLAYRESEVSSEVDGTNRQRHLRRQDP